MALPMSTYLENVSYIFIYETKMDDDYILLVCFLALYPSSVYNSISISENSTWMDDLLSVQESLAIKN